MPAVTARLIRTARLDLQPLRVTHAAEMTGVLAGPVLAGTVQATVTGPAGARAAEIAWVVGAAWQGRGIGGEAARGLVGWLRQLPVRTITAYIHPDHHASAGVARPAGLAPARRRDGEVRWQLEISGPP